MVGRACGQVGAHVLPAVAHVYAGQLQPPDFQPALPALQHGQGGDGEADQAEARQDDRG